jgi:predicted PurR-regulated permease PerM
MGVRQHLNSSLLPLPYSLKMHHMNKTLDAVVVRYVGFGLLFLGVIVLLYLVRGALPVFIVGGVLAFALEPVLQKLEKRGHSRRSAVGFVFGVYLLLSLVLVFLLAAAFQQAQALISNRETYSRQVTTLVESNRKNCANRNSRKRCVSRLTKASTKHFSV